MRSRHISRVVAASPVAVQELAADPANLPAWAEGLAEGEVHREGVDSPTGRVEVVTNPGRVGARPPLGAPRPRLRCGASPSR